MKLLSIPISILLTTLLAANNAIAAPSITFKNAYDKHQLRAASSLPTAVTSVIKDLEIKTPDLYKIVVYQFHDHYVLTLLSGKYWGITKIRVDLDSAGNMLHVIDPYQENETELKALKALNDGPAICPNNQVRFVAISSYPTVGDVVKSIDTVYKVASKKYKTVKILGEKEADAETYKNWLACSNLKGFFSIGHGSNMGIIVGDGEILNYDYFAYDEQAKKLQNTTVVINSCQVYNVPFGSQMTFGNAYTNSQFERDPGPKAYEYVGGYMSLLIGSSEEISACFLVKAMFGAPMDFKILKDCARPYDFYYRDFGISEPGKRF